MHIHDAADTAKLLPYSELADAIAEVLRAHKAGLVKAPPRMHMPLSSRGVLLIMPASGPTLAMTKLVTVHPDNVDEGLPTIQGEVIVMDANTGERLGIMDGPVLTARRTAAVSLLAARLLARPAKDDPGALLMVGAGVQATSHLEAFHEGLGVEEVYLCSRGGATAGRLADHARSLGMQATVIERPEQALDKVGLVITATTSREPVLPENTLDIAPEGLFISAIGAFTPDMAELPPEVLRKARLYVDMAEGALSEGGDLIRARITPDMVTPLEAVLDDPAHASGTGPVVFKSVGHALFDLAAARLAFADQAMGKLAQD